LLAVAEHEHFQNELIPRIATGFCSGMARTGGMCGAVSGGILAIGLLLGRDVPADPIDPCYQAVRQFCEQFRTRFGSLSCLELTGVHLGTPEGQAVFKEKRKIEACTRYVGEAAGMVIEATERLGSTGPAVD
jgi:C_GCAxxG_C_C family probable redox protein